MIRQVISCLSRMSFNDGDAQSKIHKKNKTRDEDFYCECTWIYNSLICITILMIFHTEYVTWNLFFVYRLFWTEIFGWNLMEIPFYDFLKFSTELFQWLDWTFWGPEQMKSRKKCKICVTLLLTLYRVEGAVENLYIR